MAKVTVYLFVAALFFAVLPGQADIFNMPRLAAVSLCGLIWWFL